MQAQIKDVQPIRKKEQLEDMKWALRRHCTERDYILFLIGINTGLRVGDLVKLNKTEVRGKRRVVVQEGKTGKTRELLLGNIYDEVNAYIDGLESDWLFPSRKGYGPITPTQCYRQLNKAADFAGVESVGNHTLRKTFGYWFYKQTRDVAKLQKLLNHSHPSITLSYIGFTDEEIEQDLESFVL